MPRIARKLIFLWFEFECVWSFDNSLKKRLNVTAANQNPTKAAFSYSKASGKSISVNIPSSRQISVSNCDTEMMDLLIDASTSVRKDRRPTPCSVLSIRCKNWKWDWLQVLQVLYLGGCLVNLFKFGHEVIVLNDASVFFNNELGTGVSRRSREGTVRSNVIWMATSEYDSGSLPRVLKAPPVQQQYEYTHTHTLQAKADFLFSHQEG